MKIGRKKMNKFTIMAVDDDSGIQEIYKQTIENTEYCQHIEFYSIYTGKDALNIINKTSIDLAFIDYRLPDSNGVELIKQIYSMSPSTDLMMVSGYSSIENAIEALKVGAKDFLVKPLDYKNLKYLINNLYVNHICQNNSSRIVTPALSPIIGESDVMIKLFRQIRKVALTDISVLILGESGTGKELIAKAIHESSERVDQPFIAINCGAIPRELLESELFGHEKGAFTGAVSKKIGCFEQANHGTLFLDEIGDLDIDLQVKLLRVLQEKEIHPLGSSRKIKIDVRIISATHRDLKQYINVNRFREDLYFRLCVFPLQVPALRDRIEDIPLIVQHCLGELCVKYNRAIIDVSNQAMYQLISYSWKGNVRELKNIIERLFLLTEDEIIESIPEEMFQFRDCFSEQEQYQNFRFLNKPQDFQEVISLAETEKKAIGYALKVFDFNILKTANALKIGRDTLYRKMKSYNINKSSNLFFKNH